jgi:hypothetical protein
MTEKSLTKNKAEVLPQNDEYTEYTAPLPEDREECIALIANDFTTAARVATFRFWRIGRTITELETRGEKDVVELVSERTGYAARNIHYARSLFDRCPNFDFLRSICASGKVEWSDMRLVLPIDNPDTREELLRELAQGEIEKEEWKEKVKGAKEEERKELKGGKEDKRTVPRMISPVKYFQKMLDRYKSFREGHTAGIIDLADYYALICDEDRVSQEDFDECKKLLRKTIAELQAAGTEIVKFREDTEVALADIEAA